MKGLLSCGQCFDLLEMGAKTKEEADCNLCPKPFPIEENEVVLEIYGLQPFQIYEGGAIINVVAVNSLMDIFDVSWSERADVMRKILLYHSKLYPKLFGAKKKSKPVPKRRK